MKKTIKKITAGLLLLLLVLDVVPPVRVFANTQNPVSGIAVQNNSVAGSGIYNVLLSWTQPVTSTIPGNYVPGVDNWQDSTPTQGYTIEQRRTVSGEKNLSIFDNYIAAGISLSSYSLSIANPKRGSLYAYRVIPYHRHNYVVQVGQEQTPPPIKITPPLTEIDEVLFMTDIKVDAVGTIATDEATGNQVPAMTVTWDNPQYDGKDVFIGYRIEYKEVTGESPNVGESYPNSVEVNMTMPTRLIDTGDSSITRMQYTIKDAIGLKQGAKYTVRIEPISQANPNIPMRQIPLSSRTVTINAKNIKIDASDIKAVEYRADNVSIPFTLSVEEYDDSYLRLQWNQIQTGTVPPGSVLVISSSPSGSVWTELTRLYSTSRTYYLVTRPEAGITYYKIDVYKSDSDANERKEPLLTTQAPYPSYDATLLNITPNKPEYVTPFQVTMIPNTNKSSVTVKWLPFTREPFNETEKNSPNSKPSESNPNAYIYTDLDVEYELYVSDSMDALTRTDITIPPIVVGKVPYNSSNGNFSTVVTKFYNSQIRAIDDISANKLYYCKLVAKKKTSTVVNGSNYRFSQPAFLTIYISINGDISTPPMMSKPPLHVKKDENDVDMITDTSITLEWQEEWSELLKVATPPEEDEWFSDEVSIDGGTLYFGEDSEGVGAQIQPYKYYDNKDMDAVYKNRVTDASTPYVSRSLNTIGSYYEYKIVPYSTVSDNFVTNSDYLEYVREQSDEQQAGTWAQIPMPLKYDNDNPYYTISGLTENTPYFILFRAYRVIDEEGNKIAYPSYLIVTTTQPPKDIEVKPTVPLLELVPGSETDTTVEVRWQYSESLSYTIAYSDVYDDPMLADIISWDIISANVTKKLENGKNYMYLKITNLFPDMPYRLWIQAKSETYPDPSEWSNPVTVRTKQMPAPNPPQGMGVISGESVKIINAQKNTNYLPTDYNYIMLEWTKDDLDRLNSVTGAVADAGAERIEEPLLTDQFIAKFNNLIGNKSYYIRGKTVLTATMGANKTVVKQNSYVIQLSQTEDFTDYVEITLPPVQQASDPRYYRIVESKFTEPIVIYTKPTTGEYDGDKDPDLYPLPEEDFEIVYDKATGTLTYRFRSGGKDAAGNYDNQVDQRFISKLINQKVYTYGIDLSAYDDRAISKRVVQLPYSIVSAMNNNKINFKVVADNMTVTVPHGALNTLQVTKMSGLSAASMLTMTIESAPKSAPELTGNDKYASLPKSLSLKLATSKTSANITATAKPIGVDMKLDNRYNTLDNNIGVYFSDANSGGWSRTKSNYDNTKGVMSTSSTKTGAFSAIAKKNGISAGNEDYTSVDAAMSVASKLTITDSKVSLSAAISSSQFNALVNAVSRNKKEVAINSAISDSEANSLIKSGIGISANQSAVTREQAIQSLVSLYEAKTKYRISGYPTAAESRLTDLDSASSSYRQALLKAEHLGVFGSAVKANPKSNMTMGDVMKFINIIMEDSGM